MALGLLPCCMGVKEMFGVRIMVRRSRAVSPLACGRLNTPPSHAPALPSLRCLLPKPFARTPLGKLTSCPPTPSQPFQSAPTANLDRTDDAVYSNVTDLVKAVLQLKNEICQLPPEGYIIVVKVKQP